MKTTTKLHYYYDREADILYLSQGKPSRKDRSKETSDDVVLRVNSKTGKVKGFTILNFSRRLGKKKTIVDLPLNIELAPAR